MIQEEIFVTIPEFPNYEISNYGRVFNMERNREMILSRNQGGMLSVGLVDHEGIQRRRSVRTLVAQMFVPGEDDRFDTPIQLNGVQEDLRASNIVWRPRWFAWDYTHQFVDPPEYSNEGPILDVTHGIEYPTVFDAAIANGLLVKQLHITTLNGGRVYPTGDEFIYLKLARRS